MHIILPIVFLFFFIGITLAMTAAQKRKANTILDKLNQDDLIHSRIYLLQTQISKGNIAGLLTIKAELYFNDELILICPKKDGLFNGLFNNNLPIVIANDPEIVNKNLGIQKTIKPDQIEITGFNALIIKYGKVSFGSDQHNITIRFQDKDKLDILNKLKMNKLLKQDDKQTEFRIQE
jgi:hypothetical protein